MRWIVVLLLAGCHSLMQGEGVDEPVRVEEGTFHAGAFPSAGKGTPQTITSLASANGIASWSQAGKVVTGLASPDTYAVGVRLDGLGSGYWVVVVGAQDPTNDDQRDFQLTLDFGEDLPIGNRALDVVALDATGHAGPISTVPLCLANDLPGGTFACNPTLKPPHTFVELAWDTEVDLDLVVVVPDGSVVDWKHPRALALDGGMSDGVITRDSNGDCVIDGIRHEEIVWQDAPPDGVYQIYANLFSACGKDAVNMDATVYRGDGTIEPVAAEHRGGSLQASYANGGASTGQFMLEVRLP